MDAYGHEYRFTAGGYILVTTILCDSRDSGDGRWIEGSISYQVNYAGVSSSSLEEVLAKYPLLDEGNCEMYCEDLNDWDDVSEEMQVQEEPVYANVVEVDDFADIPF